jgi:hypothetical protein
MFSRKIALGLTIAAVVGLLPATRAWADAGYTEKVLYILFAPITSVRTGPIPEPV